jgi:RsiW-degrading membrane proteinase PrsW (M82 family)
MALIYRYINETLVVLILAGVASVAALAFSYPANVINVFVVYVLILIFYAAYASSGASKNILIYVISFAIVYGILAKPVLSVFVYVFRTLLPGEIPSNPSFFNTFVAMFFGAGLMEELIKAIPALLSICLIMPWTRLRVVSQLGALKFFQTSRPIHGVLLGLSAAVAFAYVESMFVFSPEATEYVRRPIVSEGLVHELALIFPSLFRGVAGHMCWAGTAGYFIGLAAQRRRSVVPLLLFGWFLAAVLHAYWNAAPFLGELGRWTRIIFSLSVFLFLFFKAVRNNRSDLCPQVE